MDKTNSKIPLVSSSVEAGFPTFAENSIEKVLDLNTHLIHNAEATFFVRVKGDSMTGAGINEGDMLIVDKSLTPQNRHIVIGIIDQEFTVKRYVVEKEKVYLVPENPNYRQICISDKPDASIWGVVTYVISKCIS